MSEYLDHAEDVVPAAEVECGDSVSQLVENLVHLERCQYVLDEDAASYTVFR